MPGGMRVIALDIDGVICCNNSGRLEERKLQLLRNVVQITGAKVLLSTDWRRVPHLKERLINTLRDYGMEVIGSTPMRSPWQPVRPQEIVEWIGSYNASCRTNNAEPITSFVAVDDRSLLQEMGGERLRGAPPALKVQPPRSPSPNDERLTSRLFSSPFFWQAASCTRATSRG